MAARHVRYVVRSACRRWNLNYYISVEDLTAEVWLRFVKCVRRYDITRHASFIPYFVVSARRHLQNIVLSGRQHLLRHAGVTRTGQKGLIKEINAELDQSLTPEPAPQVDAQLDTPNFLAVVPERTQHMLWQHYGLDYTFVEIGQHYKLTKQRVEQIIKRGLRTIRDTWQYSQDLWYTAPIRQACSNKLQRDAKRRVREAMGAELRGLISTTPKLSYTNAAKQMAERGYTISYKQYLRAKKILKGGKPPRAAKTGRRQAAVRDRASANSAPSTPPASSPS
jgi:RNA polymerase sigma factor (sigma-70 family)